MVRKKSSSLSKILHTESKAKWSKIQMKLRKCREHDFESGEKRPGSVEKDLEVTIFRSAEQDLKVHSNI